MFFERKTNDFDLILLGKIAQPFGVHGEPQRTLKRRDNLKKDHKLIRRHKINNSRGFYGQST